MRWSHHEVNYFSRVWTSQYTVMQVLLLTFCAQCQSIRYLIKIIENRYWNFIKFWKTFLFFVIYFDMKDECRQTVLIDKLILKILSKIFAVEGIYLWNIISITLTNPSVKTLSVDYLGTSGRKKSLQQLHSKKCVFPVFLKAIIDQLQNYLLPVKSTGKQNHSL